MTSTIKTILVTLTIAFAFTTGFAQNANDTNPKTRFFLETDPATFVFNGYAAHLRIQPKNWDHILIGAGIYAMDMPSFMVDLNPENKDKNWDVRLNLGVGLFGEYHFTEVNKGWFAGTQVSIQEFKVENENLAGTASFTNALLMGYGGYSIQPFDIPLYFKAWGGLGYTSKISGENTLEGQTYDVAPITFFGTLHVGYAF
jgi:hypothetical protein